MSLEICCDCPSPCPGQISEKFWATCQCRCWSSIGKARYNIYTRVTNKYRNKKKVTFGIALQAIGGLPKRPEITIGIKQTTHLLRSSSGCRFGAPKTEINLSLAPCLTEIDISILDRLNSILNTCPFQSTDNEVPVEEITRKKHSTPKTDISIESSSIDVLLRWVSSFQIKTVIRIKVDKFNFGLTRFPVTDLRPIHNADRVPWWKRNVLRDYFHVNFTEAKLAFNAPSKYEMSADKIDLYYCVSNNISHIFFSNTLHCNHFFWLRFVTFSYFPQENDTEPKMHVANCLSFEKAASKHQAASSEHPK